MIQKTEKSRPESALSRGVFRPGAIVPQHTHEESDEYIAFEKGEGEITVGASAYFVKDGDSFYIPQGIAAFLCESRDRKRRNFIRCTRPPARSKDLRNGLN